MALILLTGDEEPDEAAPSAPISESRSMLRQRLKKDPGQRVLWDRFASRTSGCEVSATMPLCIGTSRARHAGLLAHQGGGQDVVEQHPVTSYPGAGGLRLFWQVLESWTSFWRSAEVEGEPLARVSSTILLRCDGFELMQQSGPWHQAV